MVEQPNYNMRYKLSAFILSSIKKELKIFTNIIAENKLTLNNLLIMTDCDVNCHKKCEKLTANLCGVNQKLIVEALSSVRRGNLLMYSI